MDGSAPLSLRRLRLLLALAENGSVTAAAKAIGVSQPALSQQLRLIERHYGFPLLMRTGRRVVLTQPARVVVDYARRIVRLAGESEDAVRQLLALDAGRLSVAATPTPGAYLLPRLLAAFWARHRGVRLLLEVGSVRRVERMVLGGRADLGVIGEVPDGLEVAVAPFRRDELVAVMAGTHPLAAAARLDGEALAAHPLIVRERGSGTRQTLERALGRAGLRLNVLFELRASDAFVQAAAAGLGAAVVSALAVDQPALGLRLRVRRVAGLDLTRYLAVVTHPDAVPGPAVRECVSYRARGAAPPAVPAA